MASGYRALQNVPFLLKKTLNLWHTMFGNILTRAFHWPCTVWTKAVWPHLPEGFQFPTIINSISHEDGWKGKGYRKGQLILWNLEQEMQFYSCVILAACEACGLSARGHPALALLLGVPATGDSRCKKLVCLK